jgi:hypothetical protein
LTGLGRRVFPLFSLGGFDLLVEGSVLLNQLSSYLFGFVPGLLERERPTAQGAPGSELSPEAARMIIHFRILASGRRVLFGCVFRGLMLVELPLDQAAGISAGTDQIFLGVAGLVLIEFQLSLGNVELFLQTFRMSAAGLKPFLQLVNPLLVGSDLSFGLARVLVEFAVLWRAWDRMVRGIPQRVVKSEIDLVIGELLCPLREFLFVFAGSQLKQFSGGVQWPLVHQRRLLGRRSGHCGHLKRAQIASENEADDSRDCQDQQACCD